jgi:hypothetical protein
MLYNGCWWGNLKKETIVTKSSVFWDITQCNASENNRHFRHFIAGHWCDHAKSSQCYSLTHCIHIVFAKISGVQRSVKSVLEITFILAFCILLHALYLFCCYMFRPSLAIFERNVQYFGKLPLSHVAAKYKYKWTPWTVVARDGSSNYLGNNCLHDQGKPQSWSI